MSSGPPYTCSHCDETFQKPQSKATHIAQLRNRIEPTTKLLAVRAVAAELGRSPIIAEMNKYGTVSGDSVADEFGTWNDGVRAAGLEPSHHVDITKIDLLTAIKDFASELGHAPRKRTWVDRGKFGLDAVVNAFGTWTAAVEAAGYTPINRVHVNGRIPETEIIAAIQLCADKFGRAPTSTELREHGEVTPQTVRNRFGSYRSGVRGAGLEPHEPRAHSTAALVDAIQTLGEELGESPTSEQMDTHGAIAARTISKRFGSWNAALEAAGFDINRESNISDTDLARSPRQLGCRLGRPPEYRGHGLARYAVTTYQTRFGSWAEAVAAAGYELVRTGHQSPRYYGPNWAAQRAAVLQRDEWCCQMPDCDVNQQTHQEMYGSELHIHHIQPLRSFELENGDVRFDCANACENLVTLCAEHHPIWEAMAPLVPDIRHLL